MCCRMLPRRGACRAPTHARASRMVPPRAPWTRPGCRRRPRAARVARGRRPRRCGHRRCRSAARPPRRRPGPARPAGARARSPCASPPGAAAGPRVTLPARPAQHPSRRPAYLCAPPQQRRAASRPAILPARTGAHRMPGDLLRHWPETWRGPFATLRDSTAHGCHLPATARQQAARSPAHPRSSGRSPPAQASRAGPPGSLGGRARRVLGAGLGSGPLGRRACGFISNTLRPRDACSSARARSVASTAPSTAPYCSASQLRKCTLTQNLLCSTLAPGMPATLRAHVVLELGYVLGCCSASLLRKCTLTQNLLCSTLAPGMQATLRASRRRASRAAQACTAGGPSL